MTLEQTRARTSDCGRRIALGLILCTALAPLARGSDLPDYRARTIYFLVTDRFNPHHPYDPYIDPDYPTATNATNCFVAVCSTEVEYRSYWGGDIPGVIEKLGYLHDLGASAVWLTPLMENVRDYGMGNGYGTGYHGYWVQNYDRVNPHFGSWEDVQSLSTALHAHDTRYMQDITLNHSNPNDTHVDGRLYRSSSADKTLIDSYANDIDPVTGRHFYKHFQSDPRCAATAGLADGQWSYWQLHHCLLADLSGYNQHVPTIANYLIHAGALWLDHGVDDFRLDAVKFPYPDFIARFTHAMIDHASDNGRADPPFFVGEWSNGGVGDTKSLRFANDYAAFATNIFDFQLALRLNQFIGGSAEDPSQQLDAAGLSGFLLKRVAAFAGRDTWQGVFIDNHDQMRTLVRLQKLQIGQAERERRMDLATVLMMTVRGIPFVYYGDEQYLANDEDGHDTTPPNINSDNDDPYNRPGMQSWSEDTPAFHIIQTLAALRREFPAIQRGEYVPVHADHDILVFERSEAEDTVLVAVNRGDAVDVALPGTLNLSPGAYAGLLGSATRANAGNSLTVTAQGASLHLNAISSLVVRVTQ